MFHLTRGEELTALIAVAVVGVATALVCTLRGEKAKTIEIRLNKSGETAVQREGSAPHGSIRVQVTGEVRRKGVFELSAQSRVGDAVKLAGPTEDADLERLNPAARLVDGERIVVPSKKTPGRRAGGPGLTGPPGKVNINTADRQQLESLPGIGSTLAGRIIELRKTRKFEKVDDLLRVRGIGPSTLEKVRSHVCVE